MKKQANRYYGNYEKPPTDEELDRMSKNATFGLDDLPQDVADAFRNFGKLPYIEKPKDTEK